ncbi:hypothetical protein J6590_056657 [Homalodisca vitripennis]|nr:hypothetical protein J6590_056657 [Homalodisca vitripennis]
MPLTRLSELRLKNQELCSVSPFHGRHSLTPLSNNSKGGFIQTGTEVQRPKSPREQVTRMAGTTVETCENGWSGQKGKLNFHVKQFLTNHDKFRAYLL